MQLVSRNTHPSGPLTCCLPLLPVSSPNAGCQQHPQQAERSWASHRPDWGTSAGLVVHPPPKQGHCQHQVASRGCTSLWHCSNKGADRNEGVKGKPKINFKRMDQPQLQELHPTKSSTGWWHTYLLMLQHKKHNSYSCPSLRPLRGDECQSFQGRDLYQKHAEICCSLRSTAQAVLREKRFNFKKQPQGQNEESHPCKGLEKKPEMRSRNLYHHSNLFLIYFPPRSQV